MRKQTTLLQSHIENMARTQTRGTTYIPRPHQNTRRDMIAFWETVPDFNAIFSTSYMDECRKIIYSMNSVATKLKDAEKDKEYIFPYYDITAKIIYSGFADELYFDLCQDMALYVYDNDCGWMYYSSYGVKMYYDFSAIWRLFQARFMREKRRNDKMGSNVVVTDMNEYTDMDITEKVTSNHYKQGVIDTYHIDTTFSIIDDFDMYLSEYAAQLCDSKAQTIRLVWSGMRKYADVRAIADYTGLSKTTVQKYRQIIRKIYVCFASSFDDGIEHDISDIVEIVRTYDATYRYTDSDGKVQTRHKVGYTTRRKDAPKEEHERMFVTPGHGPGAAYPLYINDYTITYTDPKHDEIRLYNRMVNTRNATHTYWKEIQIETMM